MCTHLTWHRWRKARRCAPYRLAAVLCERQVMLVMCRSDFQGKGSFEGPLLTTSGMLIGASPDKPHCQCAAPVCAVGFRFGVSPVRDVGIYRAPPRRAGPPMVEGLAPVCSGAAIPGSRHWPMQPCSPRAAGLLLSLGVGGFSGLPSGTRSFRECLAGCLP